MKRPPEEIRKYLSSLPPKVRARMNALRREILSVLPEAEEKISYKMPAFFVHGRGVIYMAAWKEHIAVYPVPRGTDAFERSIERYRASKSTVQFPHDITLPVSIVRKITKECYRRIQQRSNKEH